MVDNVWYSMADRRQTDKGYYNHHARLYNARSACDGCSPENAARQEANVVAFRCCSYPNYYDSDLWFNGA